MYVPGNWKGKTKINSIKSNLQFVLVQVWFQFLTNIYIIKTKKIIKSSLLRIKTTPKKPTTSNPLKLNEIKKFQIEKS